MRKLLANLLDIRTVIGGIFTIYGVILIILGIIDSEEAERKAQGVDINLWVGIAMLIFGLCFLGWTAIKPRQGPTEKRGPDPLDEPGGAAALPGGLAAGPGTPESELRPRRDASGGSGSTAPE